MYSDATRPPPPTQGAKSVQQTVLPALITRIHEIADRVAMTGSNLHEQADRMFGAVPTAANTTDGKPAGALCLMEQLGEAVRRLEFAANHNAEGTSRLATLG